MVWSKDGQRDQHSTTEPRNRSIHTDTLHLGEMRNYKSAQKRCIFQSVVTGLWAGYMKRGIFFSFSFLFWLHCMARISYVNKFPNQGLKTHPDETGHVQGGMTIDKTFPQRWKHTVLIQWTFGEFPENKDFDFLLHTTFLSILD